MSDRGAKRPYTKRRRAEQERATRQRITEAAVDLHGTVGPAQTTISGVAERAGVQRATVYRHFPTEEALYAACSAHWQAQHPLPDPAPWREIADPERRLRAALSDLYAYYADAEPMLANVMRDLEAVPALGPPTERLQGELRAVAELLGAGWEPPPPKLAQAAIALALDFGTWRRLCRGLGLTAPEAVELMVGCVRGASKGTHSSRS